MSRMARSALTVVLASVLSVVLGAACTTAQQGTASAHHRSGYHHIPIWCSSGAGTYAHSMYMQKAALLSTYTAKP